MIWEYHTLRSRSMEEYLGSPKEIGAKRNDADDEDAEGKLISASHSPGLNNN